MNDRSTDDAGGAKSALDLTSEKDRAMMRRFMTRHPKRIPGIDPDRIAGWLEDLALVRSTARATIADGGQLYPSGEGGKWDTRLDGAKVLTSAVKTEVMLEQINQADEHKAAQLDHDEANPAQPITVNVGVNVAPQVSSLAADPDKFREFAKLAEKVKQDTPPT